MENGTRVPEFVVGNLRGGSYKFVGNRTNLRKNGSGSVYHELRLFNKWEIRWPGGSSKVPVSNPVCGFTGNRCEQEEESTGQNINIILSVSLTNRISKDKTHMGDSHMERQGILVGKF